MWSSWLQFIAELVRFLLIRTYECVKYIYHQGYRDGRKKLPPLKHKFLQYPATELVQMIRDGQITSEALLSAIVERIREVEPYINAVVDQRFEDALKEARRVDQIIGSPGANLQQLFKEKPLLGLPFTVKNCVAVTGLLADIGNESRRGYRAEEDAITVQRMREAGAIPIAITNVPEMCLWIETSNHLHGRTNNPFDLHRSCGGSSGGEAAMVSSCASVWGVGSDIGGSIRIPAAWCGIPGHKPTPGLVARHGLLPHEGQPLKSTIGVLGPMARSVDDLVMMLRVLADDPTDFRFDEEVNLAELRYFFCDNDGATHVSCVDPESREQVHRVIEYLRSDFRIEATALPEAEKLADGGRYWFAYTQTKEFGELKRAFRSDPSWQPLLELFKHAAGCSERTIYAIVLSMSDERVRSNPSEVRAAYKEFESYKRRIHDLLDEDGVLILPSNITTAPFHHGTLCSPMQYFGFAGLINVLQLPSTVVPMGLSSKGIPLSVQIVAGPRHDRLTLAIAKRLENHFGGFIPPFAA
ncbi:fatty-acid amide hydrolase 2-B [Galendromus occidentalis]|uniref:Fatty-acid amide hydrolase 2-B n=1 Tax=Galendromus occidentalis TaxID=34638 RepID=A0AAJ6VUN1_9ACAR|nr:fatty-acid amide hydrolase 2-B [Galendromus occidentalis]